MTFDERLAAIRANMAEQKLDLLVAIHDGAHFIETPNPVFVLSGFKSLGPAAVVLGRDGEMSLIVTPAWDADRAAECRPNLRVIAADDVVDALAVELGIAGRRSEMRVGVAGLAFTAWDIAGRLTDLLPRAGDGDDIVFNAAAAKTADEIANAREATRIAELGYARMLEIARAGISEDELAAEIRWYTRTLGAEDNFLLLCAGARNPAVAPSNGRILQPGDILVAEITPSYRGQLAQICRTVTLGPANAELKDKYGLLVRAMNEGIRAARPGAPMVAVCRAINAVLEAEGYGEYCHPPHIRRRGHGLGFGSIRPGDVSLDNDTMLQEGMVFMVHPNQHLPETGYLLCGEPVLLTAQGAEPLTRRRSALAELG
ncbi:MAG: Xaa-Pro peptidase family protein [Xanthobacteraceae bacterium]|jgi:Xaa-Pro aminopeptidase